jgi:hypothetical protein
MRRLAMVVPFVLGWAAISGCEHMQDCEDACFEMRSCELLHGTSRDTCEVRCAGNEEEREESVDSCSACMARDCGLSCVAQRVCALSLDTSEYPGVACAP